MLIYDHPINRALKNTDGYGDHSYDVNKGLLCYI